MKMLPILLLVFVTASVRAADGNSVIFLHPDGTGVGHWNVARLSVAGPDGMLHWDRLERLAVYRPHQKGWLTTTSHAGATAHAFGKKVHPDSYGMDRDQPLISASGKPHSLMVEAMRAGIRCGIVNTGHVGEPGTGVFLTSSPTRADKTGIAAGILESGAEVIFCGGEIYMRPREVRGTHGRKGVRKDGRDLVEEAREKGYTVIFTREELLELPSDTPRVLGVFAAVNTYNDQTEAALADAGLEPYEASAPTFAEMTRKAIELLGNDPEVPFFLMAEEEGTDNFSNVLNAPGMLEAVKRADAGVGEALDYMERHPERRILTVVGSDSDAGHPSIWAPYGWDSDRVLPAQTGTGAALDGRQGAESLPFTSAPDARGREHSFGVAWPHKGDMPGSVVLKAHGVQSEAFGTIVDNTEVFRILHRVLLAESP